MDLPLIPVSRRAGAALLVVQRELQQELRLHPARSSLRELGRSILLLLWRPKVLSIWQCPEGSDIITKPQIIRRSACQTKCLNAVLQIHWILHIISTNQLTCKSHLDWDFLSLFRHLHIFKYSHKIAVLLSNKYLLSIRISFSPTSPLHLSFA